ncbi:MAG: hypothetical protein A2X11_02545 [Bacteroidetes bacterium GWE2_42_24]|nr:MAG: hypothetical protein A2X11_02545 [Bacteroidetes bacterium GWE2_42_24]
MIVPQCSQRNGNNSIIRQWIVGPNMARLSTMGLLMIWNSYLGAAGKERPRDVRTIQQKKLSGLSIMAVGFNCPLPAAILSFKV